MAARSTWVRTSDDALTAEVIVAGAGPAGATAARTLAATGVQTLLVEKAAFPRNKPCGGGISARWTREARRHHSPGIVMGQRTRAAAVRAAAAATLFVGALAGLQNVANGVTAEARSMRAQAASPRAAQPAITYEVRFPEPEHHWLEVTMTVTALGGAPLRAQMSRSSPGRYAVHEFAKNVFS